MGLSNLVTCIPNIGEGLANLVTRLLNLIYPERAAIVYGVEFLRPLVETEYLYFQE